MTATVERRSAGPAEAASAAPRPPQVNLLPPEVHAARNLRSLQRRLGLGLVGVLAVCGGAYAAAVGIDGQANSDLEFAQSETSRITAETAQMRELSTTKQELRRAETLRRLGMLTDVEWQAYTSQVTAVAPEGVLFESVQLSALAVVQPTDSAATPDDGSAGLGSIVMVARAATMPDTADWAERLDEIPGLTGTWVSSIAYAGPDGATYYRIQLTSTLTTDALSGRYTSETEG